MRDVLRLDRCDLRVQLAGERILSGQHCHNQAYVADGRHLGMQCHVEMTPEMIFSWCESGADEIVENAGAPSVMSVERIQALMNERLPALSATAERLYRRWAKGLRS